MNNLNNNLKKRKQLQNHLMNLIMILTQNLDRAKEEIVLIIKMNFFLYINDFIIFI